MKEFILRNAKVEDLDKIMELERDSFRGGICETRAAFLQRLRTFSQGFYLLEVDEEVLGYACGELWNFKENLKADDFLLNHSIEESHKDHGKEFYISSMCISPNLRGTGMGRLFFERFITSITKNYPQITSMVLIVSEKWESAQKIYKSNGFVEIEVLKDFFVDREDAIIMRRK